MDQGTDFEQERKRLTTRVWWVTGGYCATLLLLASFVAFGDKGLDTFRFMTPNEVGDLLAGVAGPLAFIWLVYGYFLQGVAIRQQGRELHLNTQALVLQEKAMLEQAEELRKSVEQQRRLADISTKQLESAMLAIEIEKEKEDFSSRVHLILKVFSVKRYESAFEKLANPQGYIPKRKYIEATLSNEGAPAIEVIVNGSSGVGMIHPNSFNSISAGRAVNIEFTLEAVVDNVNSIEIEFINKRGEKALERFDLIPRCDQYGELVYFDAKRYESIT